MVSGQLSAVSYQPAGAARSTPDSGTQHAARSTQHCAVERACLLPATRPVVWAGLPGLACAQHALWCDPSPLVQSALSHAGACETRAIFADGGLARNERAGDLQVRRRKPVRRCPCGVPLQPHNKSGLCVGCRERANGHHRSTAPLTPDTSHPAHAPVCLACGAAALPRAKLCHACRRPYTSGYASALKAGLAGPTIGQWVARVREPRRHCVLCPRLVGLWRDDNICGVHRREWQHFNRFHRAGQSCDYSVAHWLAWKVGRENGTRKNADIRGSGKQELGFSSSATIRDDPRPISPA